MGGALPPLSPNVILHHQPMTGVPRGAPGSQECGLADADPIKLHANLILIFCADASIFIKFSKKTCLLFIQSLAPTFAVPKLNCAMVSPEWGDDQNATRDNVAAGRDRDSSNSMVRCG
jgi:hypothetical protein